MSLVTQNPDSNNQMEPQPNNTPNWTINVTDVRTLKVSNISLSVSANSIKEFFSSSGDIQYVEMRMESETSQLAYVTFTNSQGADSAMQMTGATIADLPVSVTPVEYYQLPPDAPPLVVTNGGDTAVNKAKDVMSTVIATGVVIGKDAINKAKSIDERLQITSNASATVASLDRKIGLSEKISAGSSVVNEKVKEMDEMFQVSEKTRSVIASAEQTASTAGSSLMSNSYVSAGASWFSSALSAVVKTAEGVSVMTREKVQKAEEEKNETLYQERTGIINDFAHMHLDESPIGEQQLPVVAPSLEEKKLAII
ncbi:binding partner of ACD11 1-like isoform X2 [Impatiens glandulifera]|uniref:binding partner of ACD11 1-like isoform X2 n=1 Tax=Impatiens glandulifera TaxID=253017 RepID=UPI001FB07F33|nr:binding partner of ACD11 1-like isoform X2 [Impatiens glandulifera]